LCRASIFSLEIATAQPASAARFFGEVLSWRRESTGVFRAPLGSAPLLELAEGEGPSECYALHFEVHDLDAAEARAHWMETVAQREERPPGRDIVSLRWPTWPLHIGLYSVRPGYWAWPPGQRVVAIARCPDLDRARRALATAGWTSVHAWHAAGRRGLYLQPPSPLPIALEIRSSEERLAVALPQGDVLGIIV
jgi:hypothetical protein